VNFETRSLKSGKKKYWDDKNLVSLKVIETPSKFTEIFRNFGSKKVNFETRSLKSGKKKYWDDKNLVSLKVFE
jgi:uncharacterized protein YkuJ